MAKFICDLTRRSVDAPDKGEAIGLLDCMSCAIPCDGPTEKPEDTPGQILLPFDENPKEE